MHKAGTVAELLLLQERIPEEVYHAAYGIVSMLDSVYGKERDVDNADGGVIVIVENREDLDYFEKHYMDLRSNRHETVKLVHSRKEPYLNVFFLCNNEYGINLFIPASLVPEELSRGLKGQGAG